MKVYVSDGTLVSEDMRRVGRVVDGKYILDEDFAEEYGDDIEYIEQVKSMDCSKYDGDIQLYSADVTLFEDGAILLYNEGDFTLLAQL